MRTKRKMTSAPLMSESAGSSSVETQSSSYPVNIRKASALAKVRKAHTSERTRKRQADLEQKKRAKIAVKAQDSPMSACFQCESPEKEKSDAKQAEDRQLSPDWPTILVDEDEQEQIQEAEDQHSDAVNGNKQASPIQPLKQDPAPAVPAKSRLLAEPIMGLNQDPPLSGAVLALQEEETSAQRDGALLSGQCDDSCSPSLDTISYADMLANALACSSSSESGDREVHDEGLRLSFGPDDLVAGSRDMDYAEEPSPSENYAQHDAHAIQSIPDGNIEQNWPELNVDARQGHRFIALQGDPDSVAAFHMPERSQYTECFANDLPVAAIRVDGPSYEDFSPELSSLAVVAPSVKQPEARNVNDAHTVLDVFGTEAERARLLLYGRG